ASQPKPPVAPAVQPPAQKAAQKPVQNWRANANDDLAFTATERMTPPTREEKVVARDEGAGPTSMGALHGDGLGSDPLAQASLPVDDLTDFDAPPRKRRLPLMLFTAFGLLAGAAVLLFVQRDAVKKWFGGGASAKPSETYQKARAQFLNDTDDDF